MPALPEFDPTALDEEQFVSVSHVLPPETATDVDDDLSLTVFSIPTGETNVIQAQDQPTAAIYKGIFNGLQQPSTRTEVIARLALNDTDKEVFAGQIFDALDSISAITAVTGLANTLVPTWQNPPVYKPSGYKVEAQAAQDQAPYIVAPGEATYDFTAKPSFERSTTRNFDPRAPLEFDTLQKILVDSYRTSSDEARPTPSPGGIYPVHIHVISNDGRISSSPEDQSLDAGVYQYDPLNLRLERQHTTGDASKAVLEYLTQDADAADPAAWLMLSVDTKAFQQKYGNASQMFTGICIGSAMQRIVEEAAGEGLGTLPLFGIRHKYGDTLLGNDVGVNTVLAIGLGHPAVEADAAVSRKSNIAVSLAKVQANTEGLITTSNVTFSPAMPSHFVGVAAEYPQQLSNGEVTSANSFGMAATYPEAMLKATAEALERMASSNVRIDVAATPSSELDAPWLDPRRILPLDKDQLALSNTVPFNPALPTDWTAGVRASDGSKVYAPGSLVYYPYTDAGNAVARNTSSGIAAHFDKAEAARRGLLELIERDAIMRTWITQQSPDIIDPAALPDAITYRIRQAAVTGNTLDILNLTQENGVPVYMATVRGDSFPHFYAGAAANFNPETAMHKALDEVISGYSSRVAHEPHLRQAEAEKRQAGIFDADSHGMLYAEDAQARENISWLFGGTVTAMPDSASIPTLEAITTRFNPAVFEMDNPIPGNELKIVRVLAEDLVPITFGKTGVPYLHHTLPQGAPPAQPHFFN